MKGIAYIAIGERARAEAAESIKTLEYPVAIIEASDYSDPVQGSRWAKVNLDKLIPKTWKQCLYLDADTRTRESVAVGFDILADGWDWVMVPSQNQEGDLLWHLGEEEREATLLETLLPLQLQAGVFWWRRNERTELLFSEWRREWLRWKGQDQGAFLRALAKAPVKMWLLGFPWNGGAAIAHLFGRTR